MDERVDLVFSERFAQELDASIRSLISYQSPRNVNDFLEIGREIVRENGLRRGIFKKRISGEYTVLGRRPSLVSWRSGLRTNGMFNIYLDSFLRPSGAFGFDVFTSIPEIGKCYVSAASQKGARFKKRTSEGHVYVDLEEVIRDLREQYPTRVIAEYVEGRKGRVVNLEKSFIGG